MQNRNPVKIGKVTPKLSVIEGLPEPDSRFSINFDFGRVVVIGYDSEPLTRADVVYYLEAAKNAVMWR